jgi:prepilin-type N-terminal cleavage/methylation domain-containing protein
LEEAAMHSREKERPGFTLVELLVVIAIMGSWSPCCFPQFRRLAKRHGG